MTEDKKEELGSFIPTETESKSPKRTKPADASATLFTLMGEIRDAIKEQTEVMKENTEAINSLLTTVIGQTRPDTTVFESQQGKTTVSTSMTPPLPKPTPEPKQEEKSSGVEQVKLEFPESLASLLKFTDDGDYIKVKPRQFLGSDNFAKIASVIRALGGEYISAGKESHFRIKK